MYCRLCFVKEPRKFGRFIVARDRVVGQAHAAKREPKRLIQKLRSRTAVIDRGRSGQVNEGKPRANVVGEASTIAFGYRTFDGVPGRKGGLQASLDAGAIGVKAIFINQAGESAVV